MSRERPERDALARMRAALLDLMQARRFTEAVELAELIERIEPPLRGEAAPARAGGSAARSDPGAIVPPVASGPATFYLDSETRGLPVGVINCDGCGQTLAAHCTVHLLPCCPGSLMHGQDEGTWTPSSPSA